MNTKIYEKHVHPDIDFPFFLHKDYTKFASEESAYYHWHESIEILNCILGEGICVINGKYYSFSKGDTMIIDPYSAHMVLSSGEDGIYYCLIVDKSFLTANNISCAERTKNPIVRNEAIDKAIECMYNEIIKKKQYWKQAVKAQVTSLIIDLSRTYWESEEKAAKNSGYKNDIAENVIEYLYKKLDESVTIEAIAKDLGFNKYYLCHSFKQITGESIVGFLNMLRCNHAKKLLMSGKYTVSEAAEQSGFISLSYFSKVYKRYFGHVPSVDRE